MTDKEMEMEPNSREDLSALMDGELAAEPARFLLRRMEHDPDLARTWSRWHLARSCLQGGRNGQAASAEFLWNGAPRDDDAFAARVLSAVQAQPKVRRRWARFAGGGAVAAGVAAAALIFSVPQNAPEPGVASSAMPIASSPVGPPLPARAVASTGAPARFASPWLNAQPAFLVTRPAAANAALSGSGLLQSSYLQQAAYAPDAGPTLLRAPQSSAGAPYILLVPDDSAKTAAPAPQH